MDEQEEGNGRASIEEAIDVFQVNVQLPTGETLTLETKGSSSVRDLKIIVEVNSGVPSDLFTLVHKRADENNVTNLSDETKMADINTFIDLEATSGSVTFELSIIPWWERFVHRCMQLDNRQILKRICIKMNQISSEDRAFVAAFIAAQKGDGQLFQTLLGGDVKVDVQRTVQCSGRTLLHAAVAGGNFSCAAVIFMNGGWPLLSKPDQQGVTPMDFAKNTKQKDLVELLGHYVELQSREAEAIESTADETADVDVDAVELRDNEQDEDNIRHERENDLSESPPQDLVIQNEVTENLGKGTAADTLNEVVAKLEIERVDQERQQDEEVSERSSVHVRTGSQRRLFRESNIEGKLHKSLRASKSVDSHDGSSAVNCVVTRIDEIRPLSGKAVPGTRQREEKLPRVNTPPSSPMNSPRMRRKLVPSLLNPERPGSPVLYPRSPSSPRPMSPLVSRSRSSTLPAMRPNLAPTYNSPDLRRKAMTLSGGENRRERYVANGEKEDGWERKIGYSRLSMLIETRMFLIDQSLPSKFDRCLNTRFTVEEAGYENSGNYQVGDNVWIEYHILKVNLQRKVKENEKLVTWANHIVRGFVKKSNQSIKQSINQFVSQSGSQSTHYAR